MAEKLEVTVSARDQASPAIKAVGATVKAEVQQIAGATGKATAAASQMATGTVGGFAKMKQGLIGVRAEAVATNLAFAGIAVAGLAAAKSFVNAAAESEKAATKLAVAIRSAGQGVRQSQLEDLAKNLQRITPYSDEAIEGMMAFLASAKLNEDQIKRLSPALLDLSEFMGKDLEGASKVLAYALETGSTKGFARLKISVDEAKYALDPVGAIIDAIAAKCGGLAVAAGKDAAGQLAIFNNQVDELKESLGRGLLPALRAVIDVATPVAAGLAKIADSSIGRWAIEAAVPIFGVALAVKGLSAAAGLLTGAAATVIGAYRAIAGAATATAATVATANATIAAGATAAAAAEGAAVAAVPAIAAAGGGAAAAAAAPAVAAAGGAAAGAAGRTGIGAALGGAARLGRGALGIAGRVALPAWIAYEGAKLNIAEYQSQLDEIEKMLSSTEYTPEQKAFMKRWAEQRKQQISQQKIAEEGQQKLAAFGKEHGVTAEPDFATSAALSEAAAAELAQEPDFGKRLARYRKQGLGGIAADVRNRRPDLVEVSATGGDRAREININVKIPDDETDQTDQAVANYLDDMQYAEVE